MMALSPCCALADQRSASLVDSFREFCTLEPPNFARLDAKAAAMGLPILQDMGNPRQAGQFVHSKSWTMTLGTRSHEVVASEARGPRGEVAACGIGAADARGNDVKDDLIKRLNLGPPFHETVSQDGQRRMTTWRIKVVSVDLTLLLADGTPTNSPGVYLTLLQEPDAGR